VAALREAAREPLPDLILMDIVMPDLDGYEALEQLRRRPATAMIPVIFVSAMDREFDEEKGLRLGAVDYVTKPVRPAILLARVRTHLELKEARDWLKDKNAYLEAQVGRRIREIDLLKDISLHALAMLAEKRDDETGNHLHRTQAYVETLMDGLVDHPRFHGELHDPSRRAMISKATPLHDIGKVGIPDRILLKPGRLTPEEFAIMKGHSQIGAEALDEAIQRVLGSGGIGIGSDDSPLGFLETARQIALCHHERWNGLGYPMGLAGEAIPLAARLMALADVFDALICRRHYKEAFPVDVAVSIIVEGRGEHFDPDIVDAFVGGRDQFEEIARRYLDRPARPS
jgi:putative two-component system response regulator